jgi:hypothetical protein
VETTVPFKPTQGRPVLCRSCFQMKRVPTAVAAAAALDSPSQQVAAAEAAIDQAFATAAAEAAQASPAATTEMIAESPTAVTAAEPEVTNNPALIAAAAEAPQA